MPAAKVNPSVRPRTAVKSAGLMDSYLGWRLVGGGFRQQSNERLAGRRDPSAPKLAEKVADLVEIQSRRVREKAHDFLSETLRLAGVRVGPEHAQGRLGRSVLDEQVFVQIAGKDAAEFAERRHPGHRSPSG